MKFNQINPDTFEQDLSGTNNLKKLIASLGVIVHTDMTGPAGSYEIFEDGIATTCAVTATTHGAVFDDTDEMEIARWIAARYKHFAFFEANTISYKELLTEKRHTAYVLRFAGW